MTKNQKRDDRNIRNYSKLAIYNQTSCAKEQWGCKTTYATVAGQAEVIDKDCIAVPQDKIHAETECTSLDDRKVTKIRLKYTF